MAPLRLLSAAFATGFLLPAVLCTDPLESGFLAMTPNVEKDGLGTTDAEGLVEGTEPVTGEEVEELPVEEQEGGNSNERRLSAAEFAEAAEEPVETPGESEPLSAEQEVPVQAQEEENPESEKNSNERRLSAAEFAEDAEEPVETPGESEALSAEQEVPVQAQEEENPQSEEKPTD